MPSTRDGVPVKYRSIDFVVESDRLEDLRAAVGLHRGNAHLREDLEQPFVDRLDELAFRRLRVEPFGK